MAALNAMRLFRCSMVLLLLGAWPSAHAASIAEREKTDVVVLKNGDRLTGRILAVQYGRLELSSRHSGSVSIEWPAIESVSSKYMFRVERAGGQHFEGLISSKSDDLLVQTATGEVHIPMDSVTEIMPYESNFWHRVYGSIALGYSYAKISGVGQTSFEFDARYSGADMEATLNASVLATQDSSGTSTNQVEIASNVFFPREDSNFWGYVGDLQRNRSLGVDGRVVLGSVVGHRFLETPIARVSAYTGLVWDQEWAANTQGTRSSVEAALGGIWRVFQFSYPKVSLDSSLVLYPSLTESPRYRVSANIDLTTKISSRLAIKLSGYLNYDSRPPEVTATSTDYGVVTSLAYQFGSVVE
jgi:hypothetical protein